MAIEQHNPPHPGAFIKRVYLEAFDLSANYVAEKLKVSPSTLNRVLNERAGVSPEMALKLSRVLGRSPESWLLMQDNFDLWKAKQVINVKQYQPLKFAS
jgi:addiction module HigA family antidote